jgi:hypothetical protein
MKCLIWKKKATSNGLQNTEYKHTDWLTQTQLKKRNEPMCSTSGIYHKQLWRWKKDWIVTTTNGTYLWSFVTRVNQVTMTIKNTNYCPIKLSFQLYRHATVCGVMKHFRMFERLYKNFRQVGIFCGFCWR